MNTDATPETSPAPSPSSPAPSRFRPAGMLCVTTLAAALAVVLATRPLPEAKAQDLAEAQPSEATPTEDQAAAGDLGPEQSTAASDEAGTVVTSATTPPAAQLEPDAEPSEHPLRVVSLGWELAAPALVANDGLAPGPDSDLLAAGLHATFSVALSVEELETRLARGGDVDEGADLAILPMPTFVASYERLRALNPEVFFVVGWSRGRDALAADDPSLLVSPPARGPVHLVGLPGQSATLLSLFALDELGVDPARIDLLPPTSTAAKSAELRALERSLLGRGHALAHRQDRTFDARDLVLTSADAPRLVPMVAIASASYIQTHAGELASFTRGWIEGAERLAADAPASARRIAEETGAPEAVALLGTLGYVEFANLDDAVRVAGLSGRDAVSLELLFHRSWELWRAVGVLSTPAPEHAPLDNSVIARVALSEGAPLLTAHASPRRSGQRLVLVRTLPAGDSIDEAALVETLGVLAGVFERGELELRVRRNKALSRALVDEAVQRFGLDPKHIRVGPKLRGQNNAVQLRVHVP